MDRLVAMNVFVAVARRGSFSRAAESLGISRAMVSKQVKALEDHLGARLLNRNTRATSLTEAGRTYLERCAAVLEELEELEGEVRAENAAPQGLLKVAAPTSFGAFQLTPAVAAYMDRFPSVSVDLWLTDRMVDLVDEGLDLEIVVREPPDSSFIARWLTEVPMHVCGSPKYLQRYGVPKHPGALVEHNCLVFSSASASDEWVFADGTTELHIKVMGDLRSNMGDALRMAAIAHRGLVWLPSYMLDGDIKSDRLSMVLEDYRCVMRPVHAVYPHRRHLSTKVRSFVAFLQTYFAEASLGDGSGENGSAPKSLSAA